MFKFCIPFYRSHKRKPVYRPSLKAVNSSLESVRRIDRGTQVSTINSLSVWAWKGWELKQMALHWLSFRKNLTRKPYHIYKLSHYKSKRKLNGLRLHQTYLPVQAYYQGASILVASVNLICLALNCFNSHLHIFLVHNSQSLG